MADKEEENKPELNKPELDKEQLSYEVIGLWELLMIFNLFGKEKTEEEKEKLLKKDFLKEGNEFFKSISTKSFEELKKIKVKLESDLEKIKKQLKENKGASLGTLNTLLSETRQAGKSGKTVSETLKIDENENLKTTKENLRDLMFSIPRKGVGSVFVPIAIKKNGIGHVLYAIVDLNEDKTISASIFDSNGESEYTEMLKNVFGSLNGIKKVKANEKKIQRSDRNDCTGFLLSAAKAFKGSDSNGIDFTDNIENGINGIQSDDFESFQGEYHNLTDKNIQVEMKSHPMNKSYVNKVIKKEGENNKNRWIVSRL